MTREALPEESVCHIARRIASPDARGAYISDACGNDLALRERVVALLSEHAADDDPLESPPSGKVDGAGAQPGADTDTLDASFELLSQNAAARVKPRESLALSDRGRG